MNRVLIVCEYVQSYVYNEPFNAEPPRSALVSSYVTPVELFFKRNHGPIPLVDDIERDIRMLPKYNVTATLQCAGNRRTAMSITRKVKGVGWNVSAIGNAVWGGAKLADILELIGVPKLTSSTQSGGKHIEFVSIDKCEEENGGPYKASIPLSQATNPEADVLLAYEMNGEPLNRDHGYPLRVIVPGVIGARSVKWLDSINIIAEECQGFFMQKDYKMFPPSVDWGNISWNTRKPQMDFPVQSVICSLEDAQSIKPGKVRISGYAVSGGCRGIERVDVSIDGGKTWREATRFQKTGTPYIADGISNDKWAWVLFELTVDIPQSTEIIAKAVDSAANVQPEKVQDIWNLRGILNTSWHRVHVRIGHSNM
ncbi:sulfite oxidase isoform X3 [Gossypium hirsutum]|uniref:Sulfite oxidase n=1 Tax=Gossypium hirsutum TaxID=3635 RepID=A0A1U8J8Y3_GOSHI|nr:sulfite oxidase isoform X3 [Gossypium hirsutum]